MKKDPLSIFNFLILIFLLILISFSQALANENASAQTSISQDSIEALDRERVIDIALDKMESRHTTEQNEDLDHIQTNDNHSLLSKIRFFAGGTNKGRSIYYVDYLLPLYYSNDRATLIFFNPKQNIQNPESFEMNLGLGLRKAFDDKFILGLHSFFDRKKSVNRLYHNQVGWGAEFLSEPLDLRFNYYLPLSKIRSVAGAATYELGSTHLMQVNSTEEALRGFDVECGFPFFEKWTKTRLYPGGFFYRSKLAKDLNGFRFRTETNFSSWLSLDTTLNNPTNNKTEFTIGLRFTVPLEFGRSPYKDKNAPETSSGSYIDQRMFDRVVRDIDVQTVSGKQKEVDPDVEIIYADNSNTSGTEDGSLEHPYSTLAGALASPRYGEGKYVYVFQGDGTATGYSDPANYTLANNVTLWGSGYDGGYNGIPTTGHPLIGSIVELAKNNTVMGCQLQGTTGVLGWLTDIGTVNITSNQFVGNTTGGIMLRPNAVSTVTISNNSLTGSNAASSSGILLQPQSGLMSIDISNNTISNFDWGIRAVLGSETISAKISHNTITNNTYGLNAVNTLPATYVTIDMGGGSLASEGQNSIFNNSTADVYFNSTLSETLTAQYNWWGQSPPNAGQFALGGSANLDYTNWLTSAP